MLCYEMITGQSPFGGEDEEELFDSICNSKIPYSRYLEQSTINFLDKVRQLYMYILLCGIVISFIILL